MITDLMHANLLEVFNERDRALRWEAIGRIYADDIRWTDDDGVTMGRAPRWMPKPLSCKRNLAISSSSQRGRHIRRWDWATWHFNSSIPAAEPRWARVSA